MGVVAVEGRRQRPRRRAGGVRLPTVLLSGSLLLFGLLGGGAAPVRAQVMAAGDAAGSDLPTFGWLEAWSPLSELADLPRTLPGAGALLPDLLLCPPPRVGLFWSAGNPAGLAAEAGERRAELSIGPLGERGSYRRPLDPGSETAWRASGLAWGPLGRGGAIGRVRAERASLGNGSHADVLQPYGSAPLAILDTLGEARRRTAARLEGAGGWRIGRVAVGMGLGYASAETRTKESAVPVAMLSTRPGGTLGIAYPVGESVRVGVHGRWQRATHSVDVFSVAAPSRVYELLGYAEPVPINLSATFYGKRREEESWAVSGSLRGGGSGFRWAAHGQVEERTATRFDDEVNEPLLHRWDADGWRAGLAARFALGGTAEAAVEVGARVLEGGARKPNLAAPVFRADESRVSGVGEVRLDAGGVWAAAGRLAFARTFRTRRDLLEGVRSEVTTWVTGAGAQVVRKLSEKLRGAAGAAVAHHAPTPAIPNPRSMNRVYRKWIAPEKALVATEAWSWTGRLGIRWATSPGTDFWVRGSYGRAAPSVPDRTLLLNPPEGSRGRWEVSLGSVLGLP